MAIYISDWTLGKGNYSDISATLIHRSELTAIPGDAKWCQVLPVRVRTHRGQVINGGQSIIQLTVDPMGPWWMFLQTLSV